MTTQSSPQQAGKTPEISVYLLTFPNGKSYVGVTRCPKARFREHRSNAEIGCKYALSCAWRKHGAPALTVMGQTADYPAAFVAEQILIETLRTKAPHGYNMTKGGEGIVGLDPEVYAANGRRMSERYQNDPDFREKMKAAQKIGAAKGAVTRKAWYSTLEGRACIQARSDNPKWRENVTHQIRERANDPTRREKLKAQAKERWADPVYRAKVNAARDAKQADLVQDPEWVARRAAKRADAMRKKWQEPEYLAKMAKKEAPIVSPEARARGAAKRRETMKGRWSESVRKSWVTRKASASKP